MVSVSLNGQDPGAKAARNSLSPLKGGGGFLGGVNETSTYVDTQLFAPNHAAVEKGRRPRRLTTPDGEILTWKKKGGERGKSKEKRGCNSSFSRTVSVQV